MLLYSTVKGTSEHQGYKFKKKGEGRKEGEEVNQDLYQIIVHDSTIQLGHQRTLMIQKNGGQCVLRLVMFSPYSGSRP